MLAASHVTFPKHQPTFLACALQRQKQKQSRYRKAFKMTEKTTAPLHDGIAPAPFPQTFDGQKIAPHAEQKIAKAKTTATTPSKPKVTTPKVSPKPVVMPSPTGALTDEQKQIISDFADAAVDFAHALFTFRDADTALFESGAPPDQVSDELRALGYTDDEIADMVRLNNVPRSDGHGEREHREQASAGIHDMKDSVVSDEDRRSAAICRRCVAYSRDVADKKRRSCDDAALPKGQGRDAIGAEYQMIACGDRSCHRNASFGIASPRSGGNKTRKQCNARVPRDSGRGQ